MFYIFGGVAIEKGAFRSPLTKIANFLYLKNVQKMYTLFDEGMGFQIRMLQLHLILIINMTL